MTPNLNKAEKSRARADLIRIYAAAVNAVEPHRAIARAFDGKATAISGNPAAIATALAREPNVRMLAVGKAAQGMADEIQSRMGARLLEGLAIVPDSGRNRLQNISDRIKVICGAHPLPDESSQTAGEAALDLARRTQGDELFLLALSGGASSLMVAPVPGITLADKVAVSMALMRAGATIRELNTVRKHLSLIKGGGLLRALELDVRALALVLSDVPGNDLATIGSGPAAADVTTFSDAIAVLKRRGLWGRAPESVRDRLERGAAGEYEETLKPGDPHLTRATTAIVGDNRTAVNAAAIAAAELGYVVEWARDLSGEADELGRQFAADVSKVTRGRVCIVAGGEPVVTVKGTGTGGRAQQCALAMALELGARAVSHRVLALFAGTDGIDGPTDAAGAIISNETTARAAEARIDPEAALRANDSYPLFKALGDALVTGPTGTNVADVFVALVNF
jgi:glycerate 2-kinase